MELICYAGEDIKSGEVITLDGIEVRKFIPEEENLPYGIANTNLVKGQDVFFDPFHNTIDIWVTTSQDRILEECPELVDFMLNQ